MAEEVSQIPACQRCRLRKIRCDHAAPKCSGCSKASAACIIIDPITQKQYTREYIHDLERKEKLLGEQIRNSAERQTSGTARSLPGAQDDTSPRDAPSTESTTTFGGYVGESSGLNLLQSVFASAGFRTRKGLREAGQMPQLPELALSANELPSSEEAVALLDNYFARFHINHTFLVREDVLEVYNKVYMRAGDESQCNPQDLFRLFMLFAISGVTRYRSGLSKEHPFGYYLAALAHIGSIPLIGSPDAIQNSLLIGRFGMYHHVGTSLWDISHFVLRQCIELGYHAPPQSPVTAIEEQKQRRIFWECYILDRYSSGILGRPFAIADEDISVDLPILADDEVLKAANITSLSDVSNVAPSQPTEVSVFVFCIQLRQISSNIHTEFNSGRRQSSRSAQSTPMPFTSAGYVHMKVHNFLAQLQSWRQNAPVFADPNSLYERPEWYDFMLEKDKLTLFRGAMHTAPKLSNNSPPADLLALSLRSAIRVITLYSEMLEKKYITWTRSYFQAIFAAGLSVLFCLGLDKSAADQESVSPSAEASSSSSSPVATLHMCSQVLHTFEKEMPDVRSFAVVFDELKELSIRKLQQQQQQHQQQHRVPDKNTQSDQHGYLTIPAFHTTTIQTTDWSSFGHHNNNSHNTAEHSTHSSMQPAAAQNSSIDWQRSSTNFDLFAPSSATGAGQDPLLEWPMLSEEFMENLEAGLGEYAWGFAGDDLYPWNNQPDLT